MHVSLELWRRKTTVKKRHATAIESRFIGPVYSTTGRGGSSSPPRGRRWCMGGGHERRRPVLLFTCATTRRFAKQLQCPAQALLKRPLSARGGPHAVNRFTRVARSKPEPAKRLENPRPKARHPRARRLAIVRAIGMLKAKTRSKLTASPPWGRSSSRC